MKLVCLLSIFVVLCVATLESTQHALDVSSFGRNSVVLSDVMRELIPKMTEMYYLCRSDVTCAARFYLAASYATESLGNRAAVGLQMGDEDADRRKFFRLLVMWSEQEDCPLQANSLRPRIELSDYLSEDAPWWLTVFNTAKFCGDNQVWELGQGCVSKPDRIDSEGNPIRTRSKLTRVSQPLAVITLCVFMLIVIACILAVMYMVEKEFSKTRQLISNFDKSASPATIGCDMGDFVAHRMTVAFDANKKST